MRDLHRDGYYQLSHGKFSKSRFEVVATSRRAEELNTISN
jgi:methionyl-tRNA synthetase